MAKDAELDRLGATQQTAFERKQAAQKTQETAWDRRKAAGDARNAAYETLDRAFKAQQSSWEGLQQLRNNYGPRIDQLRAAQERAYQNMLSAFNSASSAHDNRDGASAKMYADQGHGYKAESKGYVDERRRLVAELRAANERHQTYTPGLRSAKAAFDATKGTFESAKAAHERALADYKAAKTAFDKASTAFQDRLKIVKAQNAKRNDDKRSIAERAGVPYAYRDKCYVKKESNGTVQIYFGGVGEPNGPGHGHYTMDSSGKVTYKRDPFDPHGDQNFVRDAELENRLGAVALNVFHRERSAIGPQTVQFHESGVTVKVRSGFNRRTSSIATDFIIIDPARPGEHLHLILSEHDGSTLHSQWRKNHN
jgi:uncharacterized coiled-coil DUF342 family protein